MQGYIRGIGRGIVLALFIAAGVAAGLLLYHSAKWFNGSIIKATYNTFF